ncbi:MAG: DUF1549 domain-containing protein, partial [Planctomycetota bacterium]|nr:DUF1549 domain-containing protein [Planctomycetota bacterium]
MPCGGKLQTFFAGWVLLGGWICGQGFPDEGPEFSRDVLPILAQHCFRCHGPDADQRKGDLRLDQLANVIRDSPGSTLINPYQPQLSRLVRLITSEGADRMPPPDNHPGLSKQNCQTITDWIERGAKKARHWAFVKPRRPALPSVDRIQWVQNPIDVFVLNRLEARGLSPTRTANRFSLLKRIYLDLTGVIPAAEEVLKLKAETKVNWSQIIDKLLASPGFGELKARSWLDAARFADTMGHAADKPRTMWLYRDWVIDAFNDNMPFDQFTIEQLAGDLLANPGDSQLIATGFHRNSIQALGNNPRKEEFRIKGIVDRLDTTGTTWLGLTISCAECHDHKYDPLSQKEYYELFAIFNNVPHYGDKFEVHGPRVQLQDSRTRLAIQTLENQLVQSERNPKSDLQLEQAFLESLQDLGEKPDRLTRLQKPLFAFSEEPSGFLGPYGVGVGERLLQKEGLKWSSSNPPSGKNGLSFDGTQSIRLTGENEPSIQGDFSISLWLRTRQGVADLLSNYDWKAKRRSLVLGLGSEGEVATRPGHLFLWLSQTNDPFQGIVVESSLPVNDGQWHQIAVTCQAGQSVKIFIDGIE